MKKIKIKDYLFYLFCLSIASIICTKFIFGNSPELFRGNGELSDILFDISIGYINSYIFYLLVVRVIEKKNEENIRERIETPIKRIIFNIEQPISHLLQKSNLPNKSIRERISEGEFKVMCSAVMTKEKAPMLSGSGQDVEYWFYFLEYINNVSNYADQIIRFNVYIDTDLLSIIDKIKYSKYHELLKSLTRLYRSSFPMPQQDFTFLHKELCEYHKDCLALIEKAKLLKIEPISL